MLSVPLVLCIGSISSNYRRLLPVRREPEKIERIFYTFQEAQEFLNVSHQTLYELMKQGLPSHKIGRKRVFLKEDLIRWIKEH
jgi:excisionase family DNA binding protein